jgi:hypothetical protein
VNIPDPAVARQLRALEAEVLLAGRCVPDATHLRPGRVIAVVTWTGAHWWQECQCSCLPWAFPGQWHWQIDEVPAACRAGPVQGRARSVAAAPPGTTVLLANSPLAPCGAGVTYRGPYKRRPPI